jgi:hypothetical protein
MQHCVIPNLTDVAHNIIQLMIKPGCLAVDMTVGHGYDTEFLAQHTHQVIGFDIQPQAIESANQRLKGYDNVKLYCDDHLMVDQYLTQADLFMFNLGWLPNSDKEITSTAQSTEQALIKCKQLLSAQGLISVIAYRGNLIQEAEFQTVLAWAMEQKDMMVQTVQMLMQPTAPVLFIIAYKQQRGNN